MMNLELLANELLLEIFEYFHAIELLRTFHCLNKRFDSLIFTHFRTYRLDFRTASKQDCDIICQVNLPLIIDEVISLGLSNDDEIPQQIDLFRSYGWTLNHFQNLSSLSLDHIRSGEIICEILSECPQLKHLNLTSCYFGCQQDDILRFVNCVWSLPKLIYCYLNMNFKYGFQMPISTNVSSSLEHLSVLGVSYRVDQLTHLCERTPRLRYFSLELSSTYSAEVLQTSLSSLTELNLVFVGSQHGIIETVLQYVPNVCRLKIETMYFDMNGHEWEQIIRNYLPKLKVFQLKMRFEVRSEKYKTKYLNSFRTRFWLEEHQWFVRYHYNPDDSSNMICLYTLPYSFSYLDIFFPVHFESTCLKDDDYSSYNHVQHLVYRSSLTNNMIESDLNFPNSTYLSVTLPVNNHLLSVIPNLYRLTSLEVSRSKNMSDVDAQLQLQNILDHAPHLYSLKFNSWREGQFLNRNSSLIEKLTPIVLKTRSIRQVNLRGYDWWFNDEECVHIRDSSLIKYCEILSIKVQNRMNLLYLINSLPNLRALIVQSRDDNWSWSNYSSSVDDQYVQWLQQNLSSMCSIKRDSRFVHYIRIWIHSETFCPTSINLGSEVGEVKSWATKKIVN
ncbi:unnamed protein product [Rotaria sp. Silwood1]|nr:unnamed protein product [Rotaria sp. Silwood1]CAF0764265.1 unnamed protein product [Rotaria sp. Silwood1]CAF3319476.1 unnamed protein product [Rotaria sp. Silwood1]CAF3339666.1 unnamed protein product [Rotaria sp. Silwood1]CAF4824923.1 unnamed protein product [Rotaria sp. Silwood1]